MRNHSELQPNARASPPRPQARHLELGEGLPACGIEQVDALWWERHSYRLFTVVHENAFGQGDDDLPCEPQRDLRLCAGGLQIFDNSGKALACTRNFDVLRPDTQHNGAAG